MSTVYTSSLVCARVCPGALAVLDVLSCGVRLALRARHLCPQERIRGFDSRRGRPLRGGVDASDAVET
eukprot:4297627-Alexandrium_andersonii.AAC.1